MSGWASSRGRHRRVSEETFLIKKRSFAFRAISCCKDSRIEGLYFMVFSNAKARQAILPREKTQKYLS